ncbi:MAG: signal peptide peptidase SppA [Candidatus Poribacteria bacterium]|nr:signal peptide peptidase SppA [Candidatus Poribacteria bacterium]
MDKTHTFLYTILAVLIVSQLAVADSPKVNTLLPSHSVGVSDDALATFFNPAGLGARRGLNLYYLRTYESDLGDDDAFFISAGKMGFSMEFANAEDDIDFSRYTLSSGNRIGSSLYWGTGYSWINSDDEDYDKFSSWSLGLMFRRRYLSVGAVARDLNRPRLRGEKLGRTYDFGVAIRPSTSRITFSIDGRKVEDVDGLDFSYALEIRPIRGVTLRGNLNEGNSFDLRFGINIGQLGLGTYNRFDDDREHRDGVGYVYLSKALHTTRHIRRNFFLDVRRHQIEKTLKVAKRDSEVAGALIRLGTGGPGIGRIQEMRKTLLDFKSSGKKLIAYMNNCSTGNYMLASVCDQIVLHPSGEVRLIGLRSEVSFYKGVLDKLGIRADLEHVGEYKSASDLFTRDNMSEAHREVQNAILDDLYDQITHAIAEGRGWTQDHVKRLIDQGPFTAKQALEHGLVDRFAYRDELKEIAKDLTGKNHRLVKAGTYLKTDRYEYDWEVPLPKIAIVEAKGMMVTGESFTDPLTGTRTMGSATIARAIRVVRKDPSVKAVVLRIDSGGGLVIAADTIWRELMLLKKVKPLVVSMGDVAASGGYCIAVPAEVIVAEPGTITGSIGVIAGKYSLKGLYDKIGVHKEIIKRGRHADFYSDYGDYPPEEREIVLNQIQEIYDDFISKVADGRGMTKEAVDQIGRGRIWTGNQAKEIGLVDQLGGLDLALSIARKKAGLENKEVQLVRLPKQSLWEQWLNAFRTAGSIISPTGWKPPTLVDALFRHRTFLVMPYDVHVGD